MYSNETYEQGGLDIVIMHVDIITANPLYTFNIKLGRKHDYSITYDLILHFN